MKVIGIDIGATNTQAVLVNRNKIKYLFCTETNSISKYIKIVKKMVKKEKIKVVATGGGANKFGKFLEIPIEPVDEINSIGIGGVILTNKKNALVVSIGTGTPMVSVNNGNVEHVGGTGLGGGTLKGLMQLILKGDDLDSFEKLAKYGNHNNIDLTIKDIIGKDLGKIPAWATASNLGKIKIRSNKQKDIALGLFNMTAEVIATLAFFVAKNYNLQRDIVFCGRVAKNRIIRKRLIETVKIWGGKAIVPKNAEYCTAVGAATLQVDTLHD